LKCSKIYENTYLYSHFSSILNKEKEFCITFPKEYCEKSVRWPVLFLLHGFGRDHRTVVDQQNLRNVFINAPFLTVFPDGEQGWYINHEMTSQGGYQDYLVELMAIVFDKFKVDGDSKYHGIAGWYEYQACGHIENFRGLGIVIYTGKSAFDYAMNENFHKKLDAFHIPHQYLVEDGGHIWKTVENALPLMVQSFSKKSNNE